MRVRQYICISMINLGFLVAGITVDRIFLEKTVIVQAQPAGDFEEITPTMTVGTAGIGTLLANRVAADQVMVNGYDILKLDDAILNLVARKTLSSPEELRAVADAAKVRPLRMKVPQSPQAQKEPSK